MGISTDDTKKTLLDLFCGAGGCSMGYHLAGFEVVGVDIEHQPRYPFRFIQSDALTFPLEGYDVIPASPPCQAYSITRFIHPEISYPDLLPLVRKRLQQSGAPWVIENVAGSPLQSGIMLCGSMFDLGVWRHRIFESSHLLLTPGTCRHSCKPVTVAGHLFSKQEGSLAMEIDWMTKAELAQAIPPCYTHYVGGQLKAVLYG